MSGSKPLALRLRLERGKRQITLEDAERLTGVHRETITRLEKGWQAPRVGTLQRLAHGYGVPLSDLLEESERQ